MAWRTAVALLLLTLLVPVTAAQASEPEVHLIIAAPGHNTGSAWYGHAGILVRDGGETRYYHYQLDLDETALRPIKTAFGQARFRLFVWDEAKMLTFYGDQGREVRALRLDLSPTVRDALLASLDAEVAAKTWWRYDMIYDNCATRIRDWLDSASGGTLRAGTDQPGSSLRERIVPYISHSPGYQFAAFFAAGRAADAPMSDWDSLFLPLDLEQAVLALERSDGIPFADDPVVLHAAPDVLSPTTRTLGWGVAGTGLLLGSGLALLGGRRSQDRRRAVAWAAVAVGTGLTLLSLFLLTLTVTSPDPLWTDNLNLLLVPPFILALPLTAGRALRGDAWAWHGVRWTVALLVASAALVWFLEATGTIVQDSRLFLAFFAPVYLGLLVAVDRAEGQTAVTTA